MSRRSLSSENVLPPHAGAQCGPQGRCSCDQPGHVGFRPSRRRWSFAAGPDKSLLVVDEAHSLPEKAKKAGGGFGVELTEERLIALERGLFKTMFRWHWLSGWSEARRIRRMARALRQLSEVLAACNWQGDRSWRWRFEQGRVDDAILTHAQATLSPIRKPPSVSQARQRGCRPGYAGQPVCGRDVLATGDGKMRRPGVR